MAKIITTDPSEKDRSRATGSLGKISFDHNGEYEVPEGKEEQAKLLCNVSPTLNYLEEEIKKPQEKVQLPSPPADKGNKESKPKPEEPSKPEEPVDTKEEDSKEEEVSEETIQAIREVLSDKSMDELRTLCENAEIPEEEYSQFKGIKGKEDLIQLIIEKDIIK